MRWRRPAPGTWPSSPSSHGRYVAERCPMERVRVTALRVELGHTQCDRRRTSRREMAVHLAHELRRALVVDHPPADDDAAGASGQERPRETDRLGGIVLSPGLARAEYDEGAAQVELCELCCRDPTVGQPQ